MWKQVVASGLALALLAGCGEAEKADVKNESVVADGKSAQQENSETAIYFPGGGIDFNKRPLFDNSKKDESGAYIGSVTFSFDDTVEKLSKETGAVMVAQGYSEGKTTSDKCDPCMIYSKDGVEIAFAYNAVVREGSDKGSRLLIWWKGDK